MEDNYTFNVDIETQKSTTSVASLRKEVKQLKDVLLTTKQGTEEYNAALEQLGSDLGQIKDVNELAKASTKDFGQQMANVTGTLKGISGGVQAITGGLSLMGVEMGEDTKVLKTLTSLMSMTQGIAAVESGIKAFKGLATAIKTSTIAQKALNLAMKANPIGLVATAVAGLAAGVALLVKSINDASDAQARLNDLMIQSANAQRQLAGYSSALRKDQQHELDMMRARGESEEAIYKKEQRMLALRKIHLQVMEERTRKAYNEALAMEAEDEVLEELHKNWEEANRDLQINIEATEASTRAYELYVETAKHAKKASKDTKKAHEETVEYFDKTAKKARTFWDIIMEGYTEVQTKADGKKITTAFDSLISNLEKKGDEAGVAFWKRIMNPPDVNKIRNADTLEALDDIIREVDVLSDEISKKLKEAFDQGAITEEAYKAAWAAALEGNARVLEEYNNIYTAHITELTKTGATLEAITAAEVVAEQKHNQDLIKTLNDRIDYLNRFGTEAEKARISEYAAEIRALEAKSKLQEQNRENELAYEMEMARIRGDYAKYQEQLLWQMSDNTYDAFVRDQAIKREQLEAEQKFILAQMELAQQQGASFDQLKDYTDRLSEINLDLNNLNLDKSKATFKAWGDSITKILGNVTSVMSSLMSYYQTVTDEAVADLEDKLEQGIIDQETYDKESEELKKEQFERNKNFQLAQAYVNGAAGIVQIIGDSSLPSYWAKLAAIAATIATTGIEIAAIKAQHYHPSGGGGGGNNNPGSGENWINVAPAYQMDDGTSQAQMAGAAVGSQLNSQRVYILESDIQSSNRRVQVRESNTRF